MPRTVIDLIRQSIGCAQDRIGRWCEQTRPNLDKVRECKDVAFETLDRVAECASDLVNNRLLRGTCPLKRRKRRHP